ncbi:MAG: hypothetical protein LBR22_06055 [Desulfovibrio sp.]|nr:hypothetical protein [Desulfovibrio sp.]
MSDANVDWVRLLHQQVQLMRKCFHVDVCVEECVLADMQERIAMSIGDICINRPNLA